MIASVAASAVALLLPVPPIGGSKPLVRCSYSWGTYTTAILVAKPAGANWSTFGRDFNTKSRVARADEIVVDAATAAADDELPDVLYWRLLLSATVRTIYLAAVKQFPLLDRRSDPLRPVDMLDDVFLKGQRVEDGLVFRQNFSLRSYEIGADQTASLETLMNFLQEVSINHIRCFGISADGFGFGRTREMIKRNLIWVFIKTHIVIDRYPSCWRDIIEIDSWFSAVRKIGMHRDSHIKDYRTGRTIARASSVLALMDKLTRRLTKMPEEVRNEFTHYWKDSTSILVEDNRRFLKLDDGNADYITKDLTPRWGDLDVNRHVNNVKYIRWILKSIPNSILESQDLVSITMEYRRECGIDSVVESLSRVTRDCRDAGSAGLHCQHLLRLKCGAEILRAQTKWRPKHRASYLLPEIVGSNTVESA